MVYKTKSFCFLKKNIVFIHGIFMCEGVGEDSRHEAWQVEKCMFLLECV